jgi:transcriptional regulator of acetoin/glycerol metabolism
VARHDIGQDPSLARVMATVHRAAATDTTCCYAVRVARARSWRALAAMRPRADGPFVAINCAAIPETPSKPNLRARERRLTGATPQGGPLELAHAARSSSTKSATSDGLAKILRASREEVRRRRHAALQVDVRVVAATNAT